MAGRAFLLFNSMFKQTQSSSESRVSSSLGQTASIITPIPANGVGEIAYVQGGSRYTAPARTESGGSVSAGKPVRITAGIRHSLFCRIDNLIESLTKRPMNSSIFLADISTMTLVIAGVAAFLFVFFMFIGIWASRYTKVGPNQVLVISGRKHRIIDPDGTARDVGFRIVKGGGVFVWPVYREGRHSLA